MGPSLGSNWTTGSSGGQGAWSGPSFTRASLQHYISHQQQHAQHHPQSTHTSYAYCPAHTAVSTVNFLCVCTSLSFLAAVLQSFLWIPRMLFLSLSRFGVDWLQLPSGKLLRTQQILSPSPPPTPFFVFRFNLCLLFLKPKYITSSPTLLPFLLYLLLWPALSFSLLCNLICFSFIHPVHRQRNERLIEVETLLDGFPCHYPWN